MRCADLLELISAYADGQAGPAQAEVVEAHLDGCPHCRATLHRQRQTIHLLRMAGAADDWAVPDLRLRVACAVRSGGHRPVAGGLLAGLVGVLALCWALAGAIGQTTRSAVPQAAALPAAPCAPCPQSVPRPFDPRAPAAAPAYQGYGPRPWPAAGRRDAPARPLVARRATVWSAGVRLRPY